MSVNNYNIPLLFHIGFHKTATTWFQKNYFPKNPNIKLISQNECHEYFVQKRSLYFSPEKTYFNIKKDILSNLGEEKVVVFSDEEFSGNIHSGGNGGFVSKEIADRIYNTFENKNKVKIMIVIRNQFSMIESCYRQYIKVGGTKKINEYLFPPREDHRRPMFSFDHFKYYDLIKYYKQKFGNENVKVCLFENFLQNKLEFIKKMENELDIPSDDINYDVNNKKNIGMTRSLLFINRLANKISTRSALNYEISIDIPKFSRLVYLLSNKLVDIYRPSKNSLLNLETQNYICEYFKDDNKKLAQITDYSIDTLKKNNYSV